MVVIDAYSVHRSPSFTRLFQSAQLDAEPAHGSPPRIAIEFVPAAQGCTGGGCCTEFITEERMCTNAPDILVQTGARTA